MIVQRGSRRSASTNRQVGRHSTQVVVLLAIKIEERLKLALFHFRLNVTHYIHMGLHCDLGCPSHRHDFLVVLYHAGVYQNIVHACAVNSVGFEEFFVG